MKSFVLNLFRFLKLSFGLYRKVQFHDLFRTYSINPYFGSYQGMPICRYYINNFLEKNKEHIKGRMLEIAEDTYSRMYANRDVVEKPVFETLHYNGVQTDFTIIGDLTKPETLPVDRYDCFICTQTYNFIFDVQKAIEGTHHLLKKGGMVLATVSGISQISRFDMDRWGDYWRFTDKSIGILFEKAGFSRVETVVMGNCLAACCYLQGVVVEDLPQKKLLDIVDQDYQIIIGIKAVK